MSSDVFSHFENILWSYSVSLTNITEDFDCPFLGGTVEAGHILSGHLGEHSTAWQGIPGHDDPENTGLFSD